MKVYFISSGLEGCYNLRCLFPLQANGWDGDRTNMMSNVRTAENKSKAAQDADIVVFHRPDDPRKLKLARLLKAQGKKIVFDNDDTYKDDGGFKFNEFMDKERLEQGLEKVNTTIDAFIKEADLVTCSTPFLEKEYKQLNNNVVCLPNYIDPFYFEEPLRNEGDKIRIGITGSVAITSDLEILEPIVRKYHNDPRVQLVLFSMPPNDQDKTIRELYHDEYKFWDNVNIEWQTFVPAQEYYETLNNLRLDMIIIPRAENDFNRCKSNVKFLENSMLEIPTIAQAFTTGDSPYQQNISDREHLILANTYEEWISAIEDLIANKEKRVNIGKNARKYVEENYNINDEKNYLKWYNAYESILNN